MWDESVHVLCLNSKMTEFSGGIDNTKKEQCWNEAESWKGKKERYRAERGGSLGKEITKRVRGGAG